MTRENIVYRVVAEEDPTDPRLYGYIFPQSVLTALIEGLGGTDPTSTKVRVYIEEVKDPQVKSSHKLVTPSHFFVSEDDISNGDIIKEWESRVTKVTPMNIVGNVVLKWDDIRMNETLNIHPDFDERVKAAIAKLESERL